MKKILAVFTFVFAVSFSFAQFAEIYPTNWWVGMKWNKVQLLVRGKYDGFNNEKVSINYPGITVNNTHKFENGRYLAVDVTISPTTKPGTVNVEFANNGK